MSLAISGSAIGGFIITPMVAWIVINQSWRQASVFSGILLLCLGLPLVLMVRNPKPGETEPEDAIPAPARATGERSREPEARQQTGPIDFSIGEALRTSTYWLLAVSIGLRLTGQQVLIVHIVPILVSRGVSEFVAATALGSSDVPAQVADRDRLRGGLRHVVAPKGCVGFHVLRHPGGGGGDMGTERVGYGGTLHSIIRSGPGQQRDPHGLLWDSTFGRAKFASLRGGMSLIQSIMSFGAPIAAGWVFDTTGSYNYALVGVGVAYCMSAAIFWQLKTPTRRTAAEEMTPSMGD